MTSGKEMKTKMNCLICCKQARANDRKKITRLQRPHAGILEHLECFMILDKKGGIQYIYLNKHCFLIVIPHSVQD